MEKKTKLNKAEVLVWFGEKKGFLDFHRVDLSNHQEMNENLVPE